MKVWIVQDGEYSDKYICAVCESEESAKKIASICKKGYGSTEPWIEEWDTDVFKPLLQQGCKYYYCALYSNNALHVFDVSGGPGQTYEDVNQLHRNQESGVYWLYTFAKDEEHAKRIFYDVFAKYQAEQNGVSI